MDMDPLRRLGRTCPSEPLFVATLWLCHQPPVGGQAWAACQPCRAAPAPSPHMSLLSNPAVTNQHPSGTTFLTAVTWQEHGPARRDEPLCTPCSRIHPAERGRRGRARPISRVARRPPSRNARAGGHAGHSHMMFFSSYHINNLQAESPG